MRYLGGVWHDPLIAVPSEDTKLYTCINNGCPEAGASVRQCREGYKADSPLCAICKEGHQLNEISQMCMACAGKLRDPGKGWESQGA